MVKMNNELTAGVRLFLEIGDRGFLSSMKEMDRNNIEGQAVVRYLMQIKHWPFTPNSDFSEVLEHLFSEYPERAKRDPAEYQAVTFELIKDAFDYECIVVVPEPKPEVMKEKPASKKPTRKPKQISEPEVPDTDIDTEGASDRLKRVIAIQRGG